MKIPKGWIDPGDHLPWLLPAQQEKEPPTPQPPDRVQLDLIEALAAQSHQK